MRKKLLTGLCAGIMLVGLVGCGPKESKQENEQPATEQTTEASKKEEKDTSKFDILSQKKLEEFKIRASGAEYDGRMVDENGNRIMGDDGEPVGPNVQNFAYDVSIKLPTNYTVNAQTIDKNGHLLDRYRLNKEVEERDHYWDEEYKKSTDELNNDYTAKVIATGFEKDTDTYSYDKLIFVATFLPKHFKNTEHGTTLEEVDSYYQEFDKKENLVKSDYKGYTLYTNKVDTTDGGYVEGYLYLDNVNKVYLTYFNKYQNTKDMSKEDAYERVVELLDELVTVKKK